MPWSAYATFLLVAIGLVLVPGPDFAVVTRNTLAAGRRRGHWCAVGVGSSNAVQGSAAAAGLGAFIVRVEPLFLTIKWLGAGYLAFLGVQALRSAWAGRHDTATGTVPAETSGDAVAGWRQGFLSNITNPKVLAFYLAVLPQFVNREAAPFVLLVFALSHATLSLTYLTLVVSAVHWVRRTLVRPVVRRTMDAVTGTALVALSVRLAANATRPAAAAG